MAVYESKTVTKDGRKWYFSVRYITAFGERDRKKSRKYRTKKEALEAERKFLTDKDYDRPDMTFKELYNQYIEYTEENLKDATVISKDNRVMSYFGKMNIHNISYRAVIEWKNKINNSTYGKDNKKYTLSYKQSLFKELNVTLKYGADFCGLKENVASKVKTFQDKGEEVVTDEEKIRYITPTEYNLFSSVIENLLFKTFFAFLYYMGVRKGEAQALFWEDIDFKNNKVRIIKTITNKTKNRNKLGNQLKITNTKNRKNRTIEMPLILKKLLLKLYQHYSDYEGFSEEWFVFGGYRHLPSVTIDREKDHYFKLANEMYSVKVNRITNHEFRHSHASYLISQGMKVERIAKRLGDTVAVVLDVYAHLFPETENEIIETLNLVETDYKIDNKIIKKEFLKKPPATKILKVS